MDFPLLTLLETAEDFRHLRGLRYPLWLLLLLLMTGAMCGYWGARPMETFAQQYGGELCRQLNRPVRSATPSDSTFRRVLEQCDFTVLTRIFCQWAAASVPLSEAEWVAIDGKSIKETMKDYASAQQNFVMMVSLFGHRRGFVYASEGMENQHQSEQQVVQQMLATLDLEGMVVTADALHCQKKTAACLHQQKAYYLLTVKGNQPTLLNALKQVSAQQEPLGCEQREDRSHGRWVYRRVSVYEVTGQDWAESWPGLQRGLCVERWG